MTNTDPIQPFYVPLTEILKDRGYTGDDHDVSARTSFLRNMYKKAQVSIAKNTLTNWFCEDKRGIFLTAFISAAALTAAISGKPYTASASQKAKTTPTPHPSLNRLKRS